MMVSGEDRAAEAAGQALTGSGGRGFVRRGVVALLAAWLLVTPGAALAHDPDPVQRISLDALGFQPLSQEFLLAGSSMLTVDFVDAEHLLITFGVRRLMKRDPAEPAADEDRTIGAYLVDVGSGKVLARSEWRLHDRGQYLWNLGHGRFLLRVRDRLTTFSPMSGLDSGDSFREVPMLRIDRHIVAILLSPDADLLTLETTKYAMGSGEASEGFSTDPAPVQINFYRLTSKGPSAEDLVVSSAGTIRTRTAVSLPMTTAGRLDLIEGSKDRWLFNFDEHAGKVDELAAFDTSCFPRPVFVGHSEFVAFGCRGSDDKRDFAGFNMKGEEMWQQNFYESYVTPTFVFAPAAGRFALGRTIVSGDFDPELPLPPAIVTGQEVRVYQSYNGKLLMKMDCEPVERAGQNFALSPDGLRLAVVRQMQVRHPATKYDEAYTQNETNVEVYALPTLAAEDQAAVKEAQALAPADSGARIDEALSRNSGSQDKDSAGSGSSDKVVVGGGVAAAMQPADETPDAPTPANSASGAGVANEGDVQPVGPRKPPTLYGPDEKPPQKPPQ